MIRSFRLQLLVTQISVLIFVLAAILWAVLQATNSTIRQHAEDEIIVADRVLTKLLDKQQNQLKEKVTLLSKDFGFKKAVATGATDTINSVLANHADRAGAELVIMTTPELDLVASTHNVDKKILSKNLFPEALSATSIYSAINGKPFQLVIVPVQAPNLIAWVGFGYSIDERFIEDVKRITNAEVTLIVESTVKNSTGSVITTIENNKIIDNQNITSNTFISEANNNNWVSKDHQLNKFENITITAILSKSIDKSLQRYSNLKNSILIISLIALIISSLITILISKNITKPIRSLMLIVDKIKNGDYKDYSYNIGHTEFSIFAKTLSNMRHAISSREKKISHQANFDQQTQLPNRVYTLKIIDEKLNNSTALNNQSVMIVFSISNWSQLINAYGMSWSDTLLKQFSENISRQFVNTCALGFLGGNEFILFDHEGRHSVQQWQNRLEENLEKVYICRDIEIKIHIHSGTYIRALEDNMNAEQQLNRAHIALNKAEQKFLTHEVYSPGDDQRYLRRIAVTYKLQKAIAHNDFHLLYQAKKQLSNGKIYGAEALIRWHDEEMGQIFPDEFIELAEHSGDILQISDWVIDKAFKQQKQWRDQGIFIRLSINLSAQDFTRSDLSEKLSKKLLDVGIPADCIVLEVTESAVIEDIEQTISLLKSLRGSGFIISMDDFGTGYSSLAQLKTLPLDELKIDKAFVLNLDSDKSDQKIVKSTIQLGHNLNLKIVAEGVENQESQDILKEFGCDIMQGFYLSRPIPPDEFLDKVQGIWNQQSD